MTRIGAPVVLAGLIVSATARDSRHSNITVAEDAAFDEAIGVTEGSSGCLDSIAFSPRHYCCRAAEGHSEGRDDYGTA
jgi:hypothetical protein